MLAAEVTAARSNARVPNVPSTPRDVIPSTGAANEANTPAATGAPILPTKLPSGSDTNLLNPAPSPLPNPFSTPASTSSDEVGM